MDIEFGHMTKRELCEALTSIAEYAAAETLDDDEKLAMIGNQFVLGRASALEGVLRRIAAHSEEARA